MDMQRNALSNSLLTSVSIYCKLDESGAKGFKLVREKSFDIPIHIQCTPHVSVQEPPRSCSRSSPTIFGVRESAESFNGSFSACSLPLSNSSSSVSSTSSTGEAFPSHAFITCGPSSLAPVGLCHLFSSHQRRKISSDSSDGVFDPSPDSDQITGATNTGMVHGGSSSCDYISGVAWDGNPVGSASLWICRPCGVTFSTLDGQMEHMRSLHPSAAIICNNCSRALTAEEMWKHMKRCRGTYVCSVCSVSFASSSFLKKHIQRVHQLSEQCFCPSCGKVLANKSSLQNHMKQHTEDNGKEFKCEFCEKSFIQRIHLHLHVDRHHANKELASQPKHFHCDICNSDFLYEGSLKHHLTGHRRKENLTKCHKCDHCPLEFHSEAELLRHSYVHTYSTKFKGPRPFRCSLCNAGFTRQYLYNEHMVAVHLHPEQLSCFLCGKAYLSNDSLRKHCQEKHPNYGENECGGVVDGNGMEIEDFENNEVVHKAMESTGWNKWYREVEMSGIVDEAINDVIRDGNLKDIFSDTALFSDSC